MSQLYAAAACFISPLRPDPNTRPETRFHRGVPPFAVLLCLLGAGSGATIERWAESQAGGLLRLKRSMTCPSASAITCVNGRTFDAKLMLPHVNSFVAHRIVLA
jgi:hypothetical protein